MPRRTVPGAGKRRTINMRTTPELRKKIERACGKSGRSIAAEIEHRVELTFMQEDLKKPFRPHRDMGYELLRGDSNG